MFFPRGGYRKPKATDVLWVQLVLLPYHLVLYIVWWARWVWRFNIKKEEYGEEEKLYIIRKFLGLSQAQFDVSLCESCFKAQVLLDFRNGQPQAVFFWWKILYFLQQELPYIFASGFLFSPGAHPLIFALIKGCMLWYWVYVGETMGLDKLFLCMYCPSVTPC